MYTVKEIYTTLQGEGAHTGRAAVFLRFAGCNLWSGMERDRAGAACQFCDTDFIGADGPGGGKFVDASALADAAAQCWDAAVDSPPSLCLSPRGERERPKFPRPLDRRSFSPWGEGQDEGILSPAKPYVVCTGGEPLLQLDEALIEALCARGFEIAIETNGTQAAPPGIDWICVSPKANAPLVQTSGDELKLVFPQPGAEPPRFERLDFRHFFLQPMDGPNARANTMAAARYCLKHPRWRLSLQTHKLIGLP
ncbi:MAG: 7-carboxy-7-deazaguanine synthase [Rhodomicrobium sp.]